MALSHAPICPFSLLSFQSSPPLSSLCLHSFIDNMEDSSSSSSSSSCSSASYIHMVQHLIEKCLVRNMSRDECIDALSKHANIKPVITTTVWKELEKENREFFEEYSKQKKNGKESIVDMETMERIQKLLTEIASKDNDD